MKDIPRISEYMTPAPRTIDVDQTMEQASDYMRKLHVRHLPVLKGGQPIGIVTDRDINLARAFANHAPLNMKVEAALTPNPYITSPLEMVSVVVEQMVNEKFGCVLVMEYDKLVGIFTTIDALRALSDIFRELAPNAVDP